MPNYDCIREMEIDGRRAIVSFFADDNFTPTIDPRNARMVKVLFEDGEQVFGYVTDEQRTRKIRLTDTVPAASIYRAEQTEVPFLIGRHGITDDDDKKLWSGWSEIDLNAEGIATVVNSANALRMMGYNIRRIICSPLRRTHHTAQIYSTILGNVPIVDDWRLASWKLGILEGEPESDDKIQPYVDDPDKPVPGGGQALTVYKTRALAGFYSAEATNDLSGPTLLITHSSAIAMWEDDNVMNAGDILQPGAVGLSQGFGNHIKVLHGHDCPCGYDAA